MDHISTVPVEQANRTMSRSPKFDPHGMCVCPNARHDNWECPTCHRPSFSAERIAALRA